MRKKLNLYNTNKDSENPPNDENIEMQSHIEFDQLEHVFNSVSNLSVDNVSLEGVSNDVISVISSKSQRSHSIVGSIHSLACSSEIFDKKSIAQESEFLSKTYEKNMHENQQTNIAIPSFSNAPDTTLLTYPPPPCKGRIDIKYAHLKCLEDGRYLNDIIIDFYLKYVVEEIIEPTKRDNTVLFSTFFYKKLLNRSTDSSKKRHSGVKNWTKSIDLFNKQYIIIPVNHNNKHWFLTVICYPNAIHEKYMSSHDKPKKLKLQHENNDNSLIRKLFTLGI
ncbi:sentrin-specific protease 7 [Nasonia vitripennis]|uniref:Ubiquitin-like protease family profile domain-containing protein n=1 Tax=Nasonia vitripennis TaxID=7425 RepID=A0A7M7Q0C4_NASVI|nr:sentrin-specific protease 7 [Nasonia vitripennis]